MLKNKWFRTLIVISKVKIKGSKFCITVYFADLGDNNFNTLSKYFIFYLLWIAFHQQRICRC